MHARPRNGIAPGGFTICPTSLALSGRGPAGTMAETGAVRALRPAEVNVCTLGFGSYEPHISCVNKIRVLACFTQVAALKYVVA